MRKILLIIAISVLPMKARADFWGGDLPLLAEIVFNTLHTMNELERQSQLMNDELAGIHDRIDRIRTIAEVVQPSTWDKWKDPREAVNRLRLIYHNIPKEYRSEKYDELEHEIAKAMNLAARLQSGTESAFRSGKELERRGVQASPGVAQKLTATGIGSLVSLESQSLIVQSHITTLLAQILADANEKETRSVVSRGSSFKALSTDLGQKDFRFSALVFGTKGFR